MSAPILTRRPSGLLYLGLRLPIWLYRLRLGWLLGHRFLLLNHIGRKSGQQRQTVVEVVQHTRDPQQFWVLSGWGTKSDWYQNLQKNPDVTIRSGGHRYNVHAETVPPAEAIEVLERYTRRYPLAFKELTRLFLHEQLQPGRAASERLTQLMPMVVLRARDEKPG